MKRALITGITGQDGSYLAELLLARGYQVHGLVRALPCPAALANFWRLEKLLPDLQFHAATLDDDGALRAILLQVAPEEVYHLAAQSHVSVSFHDEFATMATNLNGSHRLLAAFRDAAPHARFFFAATSQIFDVVDDGPQHESTPCRPRSPYGIAKFAAFELTRYYRETHGLHASSGILFNHESPRRGVEFVTRKITTHVARIKLGQASTVRLGNLDARRDWGHARDFVEAMWLMLQQDRPDDYVIATGEAHSIREFAELAFARVGLDYRQHVIAAAELLRPVDQPLLVGDATKARTHLGWKPRTPFQELIAEMVDADMNGAARPDAGQRV